MKTWLLTDIQEWHQCFKVNKSNDLTDRTDMCIVPHPNPKPPFSGSVVDMTGQARTSPQIGEGPGLEAQNKTNFLSQIRFSHLRLNPWKYS